MIIQYAIAIASFISSIPAQQETIQPSKTSTITHEQFFVATAKRTSSAIIADVDGSPRLEAFLLEYQPAIALAMAAERLKRFRMERNGVHIFKRYPSDWDPSYRSSSGRLVMWAMNLSESQVLDASKFSLDFQSLSENEKAQFLRDMPISSELASAMLKHTDKIRIGIAFTPGFEYKHPKTGQLVRSTVSPPMVRMPIGKGTTAKLVELGEVPKGPAIEATGPIWCASGKTMPLSDVFAEAEKAFQVKYEYDDRLSVTRVFAIGNFDQKLFELSIKEIACAEAPTKTLSRDQIVSQQLKIAFDGALSVLGKEQKWRFGLSELMSKSQVSAGEMIARSPALKMGFDRAGATPETQVRLSPALTIYLDVAGERVGLLIREKGTP